MKMIKNLNYKASESEIIRPFNVLESFFKNTVIRIDKDIDFTNDEKIYLADDQQIKVIELKFLSFNSQSYDELNTPKDDLKISIIFKDKNIKVNNVIYSEGLDFFENKVFNIFNEIGYIVDLADFDILLILSHKNNYNILSQKKYSFSKLKQKIDVPKQWMSPIFFEEQGLSKNAVWYVNWIGTDFNKSLSELIIICLNEKFRLNIERMTNDQSNRLFQSQMASSILLDIIYPVITKYHELEDQNSLALEQVKNFILSNVEVTDEELKILVENEGFHSILNSWCVNFQNLDKEILKL